MVFADPKAKELLAQIGDQLDSGCYPLVHNGGIVRPGAPAVQHQRPGMEIENGKSRRQRRPAAGPWQRPSRWKRPSFGPRAATQAAPFVDTGIQRLYEAELDAIRTAYPNAKVWVRKNGMWLLTRSSLLEGLTRRATFLISIPFSRNGIATSWGYWATATSVWWIGPRHTNFPDGSICAFEPRDETWRIGESIVELIDLYTIWALRHLHLEFIGRWPGYQSVPIPYERLNELNDHELCGCDRSHLQYSECCKPLDVALDPQEAFLDFASQTGIERQPPSWLPPIIWGNNPPPENIVIKQVRVAN